MVIIIADYEATRKMCKLFFDNLLTPATAMKTEKNDGATSQRERLRRRHNGVQLSMTEPLSSAEPLNFYGDISHCALKKGF